MRGSRILSPVSSAEKSEQAIQQRDELSEWTWRIEYSDDRAEKVPQEIAGARNSSDVENDLIELNTKTQQIQIERPED